MSDKNLELIRLAGERLTDEQQQFQSFVDEMLDQLETQRIAIESRSALIHDAGMRRVELQQHMDDALAEIHGHPITSSQQESMARLSEELVECRQVTKSLEAERRQLRMEMDEAVDELTTFAGILTMVDEIKSDFERAQSEWSQNRSRVAHYANLESQQASDRLLEQLQTSHDEVDRLTQVVEQHSQQLAGERANGVTRLGMVRSI